MRPEPEIGTGLLADEGVIVGYAVEREAVEPLTLGQEARLRSGTVIYDGSKIGDRLQTGHHVVIREESVIGDDVSIWSNSVIDYGCTIGDRVKIHSNCYVAQFTELGDDVFLAPGVTLANDLYPGRPGSAELMCGPLIESGAQIGVNATVLPFVTIGREAIVGAGAVVSRDIPARSVAFGCPAVPVKSVDDLGTVARRIEHRSGGAGSRVHHRLESLRSVRHGDSL